MYFPNPPIYAKNYSARAVLQKRCPPPPPVPSKFVVFGEHYDFSKPIMKSLPKMGQIQLFEDPQTMADFKKEMKKVNSSIMAAFLDLVQLLINNTGLKPRHQVLESLRMLFINLHHLINECRTVQGYATLVVVQVEQIKHLQQVKTDLKNEQDNLQNLMRRARKYSPKVEIPFDLDEIRKSQSKAYVCVKPTDNFCRNSLARLVKWRR